MNPIVKNLDDCLPLSHQLISTITSGPTLPAVSQAAQSHRGEAPAALAGIDVVVVQVVAWATLEACQYELETLGD
ncbi:MAG: hypothetical protein IPG42_22170 [Betaproteobacteria bacterium]|nr:hypothetical protein [Betaproteobacteria bacterium]